MLASAPVVASEASVMVPAVVSMVRVPVRVVPSPKVPLTLAVAKLWVYADPAHAFTIAVPAATAKAWPRFVASLVIVAIVWSDEIHVADDRTWVLPSLKVPVAVNC